MTLRVNLISCNRIKHFHVWGTCQCKEHRFFNMHSRLRGMSPWCCDKDFVYSFARRSWILSIWKLENYICIVVNLLTGITEAQTCMRLSWIVSVVNIFIYLFLLLWLRIFFQGEKEDSDEMIGTERATSLSSEEVTLDQRTGMIGPATDSDDEEVLVILRSMKSAVSHFVGDNKYVSAWE